MLKNKIEEASNQAKRDFPLSIFPNIRIPTALAIDGFILAIHYSDKRKAYNVCVPTKEAYNIAQLHYQKTGHSKWSHSS